MKPGMVVKPDIEGRRFVIAIDGPGGVGKTTVARAVAGELGCPHLDTGAFYRAATLVAMLHRLDLANEAAVMAVVAAADLAYEDGSMLVEGVDLSEAIRSEAVVAEVGRVSTLAGLRMILVQRQREWLVSQGGRAVVEGRDIGTVVFPAASLKVFLTARPDVRAARRAKQASTGIEAIREDLARRDHLDSTRHVSPLARAEDAVVIDTSDLTQHEVVSEILGLCEERGLGG